MYVPGFLQNRVYLLTIIAIITTISALGPFFFEDIACSVISTPTDEHGHMSTETEGCWQLLAHETLHVAAITFGVFLFILSIIAYFSTRNTNMIFTAMAFATFTFLSIFLLEEDLVAERIGHQESVVVDVLLTVMIGFFAIGVFSNQKFPTRRKYD
ncbi:MAG: hypothetical protein QF488_04965 [Candidatus Nitrosopelagicus sp.]|nr:hypothetical protein [Candidatus Nitrosopelagicus sp.]